MRNFIIYHHMSQLRGSCGKNNAERQHYNSIHNNIQTIKSPYQYQQPNPKRQSLDFRHKREQHAPMLHSMCTPCQAHGSNK